MEDTQLILVDDHNGIYSWYELAIRYYLHDSEGKEITGLAKKFHPDNENWMDEVDYYDSNGLYVENDGKLWPVSQDGDIWAINPNAVWNDLEECYQLPVEVK